MRHLLLTAVFLFMTATAFAESADVAPEGGSGPPTTDVFPVIRSFNANSGTNVLAVGIGYGASTGVIWVSDGGVSSSSGTDNVVSLFACDGTFLASFPQNATEGFGWRDPAYTGDHFFYGALSSVFHVNEATFAIDNTFSVPGGPAVNRGIGLVSRVGSTYTCRSSTFGSPIFTWTWPGAGNATVTGSCTVTDTGIYGLALDTGRNSMWATTASATGVLNEYGVTDCTHKPGSPHSTSLGGAITFGGCEVFNCGDGCRLWVINQATPDAAVQLNTPNSANPFGCPGATAVEPATWGAIKASFND